MLLFRRDTAKKDFKILTVYIFFLTIYGSATAFGHGGGLNSSGGHNCYVGSCTGTYHSHRNRSSNVSGSESSLWEIALLIFLAVLIYGLLTSSKEKADKGGFLNKAAHFTTSLIAVFGFCSLALYLLG